LDRFEAGSRWLRDLLLYSRVGLHRPFGAIIIMVVQTGKIEIEAGLWCPSAVLAIVVPAVVPAVVLVIVMPAIMPCHMFWWPFPPFALHAA
jgi:hypothetical protein